MRFKDFLNEQQLAELDMTLGTPSADQAAKLDDPALKAGLLAKQQQQKLQQRKAIQDQINAKQKELATLRQQLAQIK